MSAIRVQIKEALRYIIITLIIWGIVIIISPAKGIMVGEVAYSSLVKAIEIIIAVFIVIGLIQVWIGTEVLSKIFGKEAGWKGLILASIIPMFLGGSLFTMFPLLKILRDKGASTGCILAFIVAWGGKLPLLPLEAEFLGWKFTVLRTVLLVPFAIVMGLLGQFVLEKWQNKSFIGSKGII